MVSPVRQIRWIGCLLVCLLTAPSAPSTQPAGVTARLPGLGDMLATQGPVLKDRNGDGVVDFVDAHFVLGDAPGPADVAAAANVAARLAHESAEINLPWPAAGARVSVAVGAAGVRRAGLTDEAAGLAGLVPGEGLVAVAGSPDRPILVVAGRDDDGTRAAGEFAAARLPYAWDVAGMLLSQVEADASTAIESVSGCQAGRAGVVVRLGGDAIERVTLRATCRTAAQLLRLQASLRTPRQPVPPETPSLPALDFPFVKATRFELRAPGAPTRVAEVPRRTAPAAHAPPPRRGTPVKDGLDLSSFYDIDGMLGDGDSNLIPDRTDILLVPAGPGTEGTIDLAARLALESAGVALPLVVPAPAVDAPATAPTLVLIGTAHPLIDRLVSESKLDKAGLAPGDGAIRVVRKAFGEKSAIVITGSDGAGLARALAQASVYLPHLWARGKDRPSVEDVEEDLRRFVSGRSAVGQAAIGLYKLDQLLKPLARQELAQLSVHLAVDRPDPGLAAFVEDHVRATMGTAAPASVDVRVEGLDVRSATPAMANGEPISGAFGVASEVDEFWAVLRNRVLPAVKRGAVIRVEARLSEPRDLRLRLERAAREALLKAGAASGSTVRVLSAYKQGYSWLAESVGPRLAGTPVDRILIRFAEAGPPPGWTQQAMFIPTRWLHEVFPIDEVLARDLKMASSKVAFEKTPVGSPTYDVTAFDASGGVLLRETFEPATVIRPYFDRFPDYERVRVATGAVTAIADGRLLLSERITTDLERFWNVFQARTLPAIYDYVMAQSAGKPKPEDAPHFGELRVEVSLSEPHEKIGIDQERISPMEALHEDVYFGVLHFFDVLGRMARGAPLDYPGHIVPVMRATSDGTPGQARITLTGFTVPRPAITVQYTDRAGRHGRQRLDIPAIAVDRPSAVGAILRPHTEGLHRLDLRVKVDSGADERATLIQRARADRVDAQVLSAEQVAATLAALERLRRAGCYRTALSYGGLGTLRVTAAWTHDDAPGSQRTVDVAANGEPPPLPDVRRYLPPGPEPDGRTPPTVQWQTPIAPAEAWGLLASMAGFRGASVYKAGDSYLGQDIWAMDLTSAAGSSHWSQAKATTLKPTALFSGRQHANEVSSTSHLLRLAERLLTVPEMRRLLDRVNVVIQPITNADGAQLAHELWQDTPDYMLHAAYLGALGVDVTAAQWEPDAIYSESKIRAQLWRTWLPDLFLDPHGYPSHEWVQPFSEYAAWVRTRVTESRDWWGMRGWFMPGFAWIDDPKYPRHPAAAFELRRRSAAAINALPAVKALNERAYDRYRRYGFAWNTEDFKLDFTDGVLVYSAVKGSKPNPRGNNPMLRQPNITVWYGVTEAPDEPARGDWLELVASAGLAWDEAMVRYLAEAPYVVERKRDPFWGGVTFSTHRARPPK